MLVVFGTERSRNCWNWRIGTGGEMTNPLLDEAVRRTYHSNPPVSTSVLRMMATQPFIEWGTDMLANLAEMQIRTEFLRLQFTGISPLMRGQ